MLSTVTDTRLGKWWQNCKFPYNKIAPVFWHTIFWTNGLHWWRFWARFQKTTYISTYNSVLCCMTPSSGTMSLTITQIGSWFSQFGLQEFSHNLVLSSPCIVVVPLCYCWASLHIQRLWSAYLRKLLSQKPSRNRHRANAEQLSRTYGRRSAKRRGDAAATSVVG